MASFAPAVREAYLRMVRGSSSGFSSAAQDAMAKLSPDDTVELLRLLNSTPHELDATFAEDAQLRQAVASAAQGGGVEQLLSAPPRLIGQTDPMVIRALSGFERNIVMYVQRPERIRELQNGLSTAQSEAMMAALCDCYPLAVLHQGLDRQRSGDAPLDIAGHILGSRGGSASNDVCNEARVAELFRRLLSDFEAYKRTPHAYEGWLAGCSRQERRMLEALITAFWDWPAR